jgi:hypothetical protein
MLAAIRLDIMGGYACRAATSSASCFYRFALLSSFPSSRLVRPQRIHFISPCTYSSHLSKMDPSTEVYDNFDVDLVVKVLANTAFSEFCSCS